MMRSLFAGVSGLRTHQTRMDVIGNNISNVNTLGFKKSAVTFQDLYSQTLNPAAGPSGSVGGVNPKQVGLGTSLSAITAVHSPGSAQYTGRPLDVAIEGDGFFVVKTPDGEFYTRSGNFQLDYNGALLTPTGGFVQGYNPVYNTGTIGSSADNADKVANVGFKNPTYADGANITAATSGVYSLGALDPATGVIQLHRDGSKTPVGTATITGATFPITATGGPAPAPFNTSIADNTTLTVVMRDELGAEIGTFTFTTDGALGGTGATAADAQADIAKKIENAFAKFQVRVTNNDGYVAGNSIDNVIIDPNIYTNVAIDARGAVIGQLINDVPADPAKGIPAMQKGQKVVLGFVTLANFVNTSGLEKTGNNMYAASSNSGAPLYGEPGQTGYGALSPSSLEMSNVDMSEEMVNMIITQRGFQANSRIITTSDQILEELVNLKR